MKLLSKQQTIIILFAALLPAYILLNGQANSMQKHTKFAANKTVATKDKLGVTVYQSRNTEGFNVPISHWQDKTTKVPVYFVPRTGLPIIDVNLVYRAGSAYDQVPGTAYFTNSLLKAGTKDINFDQVATYFDNLGVQFNTSVKRDSASIALRMLSNPKTRQSAIAGLTKLIAAPLFPSKDLTREKKRTQIALQQYEVQPKLKAQQEFYKLLYKDTPYGHLIIGNLKSLADIDQDLLQDFYAAHYNQANAMITIVGDLDERQAHELAAQLAQAMPSSGKQQQLQLPEYDKNAAVKQVDFNSQQTHIIAGLPIVSYDSPDYFALYLGNHILGGQAMVSRLFKQIREQHGLVYDVHSYLKPLQLTGPYILGLQTRNEKAKEALARLQQILTEFVEQGPTEAEVAAAKQNIRGLFPLKLNTNAAIIRTLNAIAFYKLPLDFIASYLHNIDTINKQDIKQALQNNIKVDQLKVVAVGQASND